MDRSQCRRVSPAVAGTGGVQGRVRAIREWPLTLPATGVCSSPIRSIWRHECEWLGFPDVCALVAAGLLWVHNTMPMPTSRRNDSSACRRRHSAGSSRSWLGICVRCTVACQGQPVTGDAPGALRSRGGGESVSGVGRSLVGLPMACCGMVAASSGRYREGASNLCPCRLETVATRHANAREIATGATKSCCESKRKPATASAELARKNAVFAVVANFCTLLEARAGVEPTYTDLQSGA